MALTALLAAATVLAACSSSKSSSASQSSAPTTAAGGATATTAGGGAPATTAAAAAADPLGTPNAASGTPVKVGFISDGKTANIDNSSEKGSTAAAVKYINDYLGGVGGHPISLDYCETQQTPSGATDCGNQMIADKVPVVVMNVSGQAGAAYKPIAAANIPFVGYQVADAAVLQAKTGTYILANPLVSSFAGPAKIGQLDGAKKAADITIDVPAASGPAKALDPAFYKNAGLTVDVVAIPPGTADMTPQIQAELAKGPDLFHVTGDVPFCTSAIKALKTIGFTKDIVVIAQCISATSAASIPGGYAGVKLVTEATNAPTDADVKIYTAAMAKYSPDTPPFVNGVTQGAFAVLWAFARATSGITGDVTSTSVETAFTTATAQPLPFGGGTTFQCTGTQVAITPSVCSTGALEATLDQSGNPTGTFTPLDATALLKLG